MHVIQLLRTQGQERRPSNGDAVSALRSCIRILAGLRNESFTQAIKHFDERFHFNWVRGISSEPPPEGNLIAALNAVETERNALIEDIHVNALKQKAAKIQRRMLSSHKGAQRG